MEPVYYTVDRIDGDYARLISDNGIENQVAMFLLPEGTTVGSRLVREIFVTYTICASASQRATGMCAPILSSSFSQTLLMVLNAAARLERANF